MSQILRKDHEFQKQLAGWRAEFKPGEKLADYSLGSLYATIPAPARRNRVDLLKENDAGNHPMS